MDYSCEEIAKMIDHSLLRPELTDRDILEGCDIARKYQVAAVCCRPSDVIRVKELLRGSGVKVDAVVGFPHGSHKTKTKVFEAEEAIKDGAEELDMVIHIGKLRSRDFDYVRDDIEAVANVAHQHGVILKVILENCYLDDELKEIGCKLAEEAGADFVKTSTGFAPGGATIEDLQLMRRVVSPRVQVKAAGGVRTLDAALKVKEVGATRFGATRTVEIIEECKKRKEKGDCC
ncbi:MAG: deoxyribose-phosphate aldolase [Candidatus Atribacteria bacterium]|nr:deoxyribose-phosphate aldolase [Candidatus Atribacteria bacterium]